MIRYLKVLLFPIFLAAATVRPVLAQVGPVIVQPRQGEVLQGMVTIEGTSDIAGFVSYEVAFAYTGDTTGTWFLIAGSSQPVDSNTLANWDTTTITDGNYSIRLRVTLADGKNVEVILPDLRVRNYTPVETPTPAPTAQQPTQTPTVTQTRTPFPSPTFLPRNPAVLTLVDVSTSLGYGGLGTLFLLIVLGLFFRIRRK